MGQEERCSTQLAQAIYKADEKRLDWLLENGAGPNQPVGIGGFYCTAMSHLSIALYRHNISHRQASVIFNKLVRGGGRPNIGTF